MKKIILIVCHGNMHRSVIAEQCINKALQQSGLESAYRVLSRGTQGTGGEDLPEHKNLRDYENEWLLTKPVLEEIGITIPVDQVATPINARIVEEAALILAMEVRCASHKSEQFGPSVSFNAFQNETVYGVGKQDGRYCRFVRAKRFCNRSSRNHED